jgi:hexosaminidase
MKNVIYLLFCWMILPVSGQISSILPSPVTYVQNEGAIQINQALTVNPSEIHPGLFAQFKFLGETFHGLTIQTDVQNGMLNFKKLVNVKQDSYSINIADRITISYSSDASCYYAMTSLMQLMKRNENGLALPKCFVKDYPNYQWRGLHLDVSRHFFTVEEVKRFIDLMSFYKFNTFHWHLTDDQGWRIEIKKYPKLTEIGAWRDSTVNEHYTTVPRTYTKARYGGFYTQDQIKDVVAYAEAKYVTIVPEIEMPGHARAALAAYPEYSCTGKAQGVEGLWGIFDDIFCSKPESIQFLQDILSEVIPLFPGEYIHIGGDEAPKTRWHSCPKCQGIMSANNLKDEHELQSYFIRQMDAFVTSKGKKIIGWDEILEGGLSPNAAVMSWRGFDGGLEAAKQGHYVVMTPGSHCYFDHYQGKGKDEPLAIGGYTSLEKVFTFNPIPPDLSPAVSSYILGGQANIWTEYIPTFSKVEYMTYPRAIALSEALWCTTKPTYDVFLSVLVQDHFPQLVRWKVNYSKSALKASVKTIRTNTGIELKSTGQSIENGKLKETSISFPFTRSKKKTKTEALTIHPEDESIRQTIQITNHLALGANVRFVTEPSPKYNGGDIVLVDGQFGARPWKGHEWIGFDTNVIVLEIDLEKITKIREIKVSFLQDENSWIHTPNQVEIESILPVRPYSVGRSKAPSLDTNNPNSEIWNIRGFGTSQILRITIKGAAKIPQGQPGEGNMPWIFIDEIQIN